MTNDNYRQILTWAKILEKVIANITPDMAKECADFCYDLIRFNIDRMRNDREKALFRKYAKILEYIKPVLSGDIRNIKPPLKDNCEQLSVWAEILWEISENLDFDIGDNCINFCSAIINACIPKMQSDRERSLARKFEEIIIKINSWNPYVVCPDANSRFPDEIEKAQPPIPKIIHYCWLSNDPIPEKFQQCMKSWREKLPDYEFLLWNFDRFDINTSPWVKQAFDSKKYAFASDYIRLHAVYTYGGIHLDMDVEVVKPFDDLLFTDCMIAREDYNTTPHTTIRIEGACFGAVKGHPFIKQCLAFYRNRNFHPDKMYKYTMPDVMGAVLTTCFKDTLKVLSPDYFSAKSVFTGIITTTENTRAIHHFTGSWGSPEEQSKLPQRLECYSQISQNDMDKAIALLRSGSESIKVPLYHTINKRLYMSTAYDKKKFTGGENIFTGIYRSNYWGSGESRSGGGSEINSTVRLREFLPNILKKYKIKTVLDAPCGDYNWMKAVDKAGIDYIGGDIVPDCVENNNKLYREENVSFSVIDITKDELPTVDMIICKDCLQHLSSEDVWMALNNFKKSGSTWLLTTSYPLTLRNWDIQNGDYRPLNLLAEPFNLNCFHEKIHEDSGYGVEEDKMMFLYRLDDFKLDTSR